MHVCSLHTLRFTLMVSLFIITLAGVLAGARLAESEEASK